jgi:hypothetical protein
VTRGCNTQGTPPDSWALLLHVDSWLRYALASFCAAWSAVPTQQYSAAWMISMQYR